MMKNKQDILVMALIAVCFLFAGTVYMAQSFRLMAVYDMETVDLITSGWNYLLQAAGIGLFALGLWRVPRVFGSKSFFILTLLAGGALSVVMQLSASGGVMVVVGYVFHLLVGTYFGWYLALIAARIPTRKAGLSFGVAYAIGSVGTYLFSIMYQGKFLEIAGASVIYLLLTALCIGLALFVGNVTSGEEAQEEKVSKLDINRAEIAVPMIVLMTVISVLGSGFYYSLPQAENVNWSLIRVFYAAGLVLAGFLFDRNRRIGEICTIASLTYPLIAGTLINDGVVGSVALSFGYFIRGFLTIYYVLAFTDFGAKDRRLLPLAGTGMFLSRVTEGLLSMLLMKAHLSDVVWLLTAAACFIPVLFLFFFAQEKEKNRQPINEEKRLALFSENYGLTAREAEILTHMAAGCTDAEIAEKCYISKNTVRFHVSNLLRKTETSSRQEAVRALMKWEE